MMRRLSKKARQEAQNRREERGKKSPAQGESARPAPHKPPPEPHGGVAGYDSPLWQAMRQAREAGFILVLPGTENEFVADVRLARPILEGALRRAEEGTSRVEITLREVTNSHFGLSAAAKP